MAQNFFIRAVVTRASLRAAEAQLAGLGAGVGAAATRGGQVNVGARVSPSIARGATDLQNLGNQAKIAQGRVGQFDQSLRSAGVGSTGTFARIQAGQVSVRALGNEFLAASFKVGLFSAAVAGITGIIATIGLVANSVRTIDLALVNLNRVVSNFDEGSGLRSMNTLMQELRVSSEQTGDAFFEMGKVFGEQGETIAATESVLLAAKVAEIDVADASRRLIQVSNAYKLSGFELTGVIDKLNEQQNTLGVEVGKTLETVARAAPLFRAAGGELDNLVGAASVGIRFSGFEPSSVSRALQRLTQNITSARGRERIQEALQGTGIELVDSEGATRNIDAIIKDIGSRFDQFSAQQQSAVSEALAGRTGGVASILTSILQNFDQVEEQSKISAQSSGSAFRELSTVFGSIDEQVASLKAEIESLGVVLKEAGVGNVFAALLQTLRQVLNVFNSVIGLLNQLGPLTQILTALAAVGGLNKLVGGRIAATALGGGLLGGKQNAAQQQLIFTTRQANVQLGGFVSAIARATGSVLGFSSTQTAAVTQSGTALGAFSRQLFTFGALFAAIAGPLAGSALRARKDPEGTNVGVQAGGRALERAGIGAGIGAFVGGPAGAGIGAAAGGIIGSIEGFIAVNQKINQASEDVKNAVDKLRTDVGTGSRALGVGRELPEIPLDDIKNSQDKFANDLSLRLLQEKDFIDSFGGGVSQFGNSLEDLGFSAAEFAKLAEVGVDDAAALVGAFTQAGALTENQKSALDTSINEFEQFLGSIQKEDNDVAAKRFEQLISVDNPNSILIRSQIDNSESILESIRKGKLSEADLTEIVRIRDQAKQLRDREGNFFASVARESESLNVSIAEVIAGRISDAGEISEALTKEFDLLGAGVIKPRRVQRNVGNQIAAAEILIKNGGDDAVLGIAQIEQINSSIEQQIGRINDAVGAGVLTQGQANQQIASLVSDSLQSSNPQSRIFALTQLNEIASQELQSRIDQINQEFDSRDNLAVTEAQREQVALERASQLREFAAQTQRAGEGNANALRQVGLGFLVEQQASLRSRVEYAAANRQAIQASLAAIDSDFKLAIEIFRGTPLFEGVVKAFGSQRKVVADALKGASNASKNANQALKDFNNAIQGSTDPVSSEASGDADRISTDILQKTEEAEVTAEELIRSKFELLKAIAGGDDIRLARLALQEAQQIKQLGGNRAERNQRQAAVINARRDLQETVVREQIEDIEFQLEFDKITNQQAIERLRKLLAQTKGNKDLRRDLLRQIRGLSEQASDEGSFGLPEFRLPSEFEIGRAISGGLALGKGAGQQVNAQVSNRNEITIQVSGDKDLQRVAQVISDATGANLQQVRSLGFNPGLVS